MALIWIGIGIGLYALVCVGLAYALVYPPKLRNPDCPPYLQASVVCGTECWISQDKGPGKAVFILLHEHIGTRARWIPMAKRLTGAGFGVIVAAMPGHAGNPERQCGFGLREAEMAAQMVRWARIQFADSPIILGGVSLGGAASWLASEIEPPDAVFSEGCFTDMSEGMRDWFHMLFPGAFQILAPAHWLARKLSGIEADRISPLRAARAWHGKPCAIFHGERDREFPLERGQRLADACGAVMWVIPKSGHVSGQKKASEAYFAHLLDLAERGSASRNMKLIASENCGGGANDRPL